MVDTARQLLDELMGRNRNLDPTAAKSKKIQWDDPEVIKLKCFSHQKNDTTCKQQIQSFINGFIAVLSILFGKILSARFVCQYTS